MGNDELTRITSQRGGRIHAIDPVFEAAGNPVRPLCSKGRISRVQYHRLGAGIEISCRKCIAELEQMADA